MTMKMRMVMFDKKIMQSEAYYSELEKAATAPEVFRNNDTLEWDLDFLAAANGEMSPVAMARNLVRIHYIILHPLLRIHSKILRSRIIKFAEDIEGKAPVYSAAEVYDCLKNLDQQQILNWLASLDMELVSSFQKQKGHDFCDAFDSATEGKKNRLFAVKYLYDLLRIDAPEMDVMAPANWDDMDSCKDYFREGLSSFWISNYQSRLLEKVSADRSCQALISELLAEGPLSFSEGALPFFTAMKDWTGRMMKCLKDDYMKHKADLTDREIAIVEDVLSRNPLFIPGFGTSKNDSYDYAGTMDRLSEQEENLELNKYDGTISQEDFVNAQKRSDDSVYKAPHGITGKNDETAFKNYKVIYRFLVDKGCISDSLENYKILMLRFTGRDLTNQQNPAPVSWNKWFGDEKNGMRCLYYFIKRVVDDGAGRNATMYKYTDRFFHVAGKSPKSLLADKEKASLAASRADSDYKEEVDALIKQF